jgi:superfamily II DNA helicase RecQ
MPACALFLWYGREVTPLKKTSETRIRSKQMAMAFHWIPARNGQAAQAELNTALRSLRVLSVEKHFCPLASDPGWAVCVEYLDPDQTAAEPSGAGGKRIDYREILDPATFTIFAALRKLRKEIAAQEAVPIYTIMTNEQMAAVARKRCQSLADLESVDGLGAARTQKYGPRFLVVIRQAVAETSPPAHAEEDRAQNASPNGG